MDAAIKAKEEDTSKKVWGTEVALLSPEENRT